MPTPRTSKKKRVFVKTEFGKALDEHLFIMMGCIQPALRAHTSFPIAFVTRFTLSDCGRTSVFQTHPRPFPVPQVHLLPGWVRSLGAFLIAQSQSVVFTISLSSGPHGADLLKTYRKCLSTLSRLVSESQFSELYIFSLSLCKDTMTMYRTRSPSVSSHA